MEDMIVKEINDPRAMTDIGAAIFVKRAGATKYSLWMPVTNIPATGSAPDQLETTVTTSRKKNYTFGRQDNAQKECTFMAHRDNFEILRQDYNQRLDFLQVNPDGVGFKFQGFVSFYQDEVALGSNLTGKAVITVTQSDELPIIDVSDLIMETVTFISAVPAIVTISGAASSTKEINVVTDPADATLAATSLTTSVATVAVSGGKVTITSVASGSAIIKLTATKSDCATGTTYILAKVKVNG